MVALVPLREQIVRKALLLRVDDVPLEGYFSIGAERVNQALLEVRNGFEEPGGVLPALLA